MSRQNWIAALSKDARATKAVRLTGIALADYAKGKALGNAHPGRNQLAKDMRVSVRTIERHLARLRSLGWIERTAFGSTAGDRKFADVYSLRMAPAEARPVDTQMSSGRGPTSRQMKASGQGPTSRHLDVDPSTYLLDDDVDQDDVGGKASASSSSSSSPFSAAAAPAVVESETNSDDDKDLSGRDEVEVAGVVGPLQLSDLKAADMPDAESYLRFASDPSSGIRTPWAYLRRCVRADDLKGLKDDFEDWDRANRKAELAAVEATFAHHAEAGRTIWDTFSDLPRVHTLNVYGRRHEYPSSEAHRGAVVTALGEALERGATWDSLVVALQELPPDQGRDRPELLAWLAQQMPVAQPATEDPPLRPDSAEEGKAEMSTDQYEDESVAAYYAELGF